MPALPLTATLLLTLQTSPATTEPTARVPIPRRLTYVVHAYANFSPDDSTIVFQSNASGNWDLYTMNVNGEGLKRIVDSPAGDITPVFSPDGKQIVFVSERDGDREVYVCDADGSNQRRLTNDKGHDLHPVWSADGKRIMFSSNRGNASTDDYDIYVMDSDGDNVQ